LLSRRSKRGILLQGVITRTPWCFGGVHSYVEPPQQPPLDTSIEYINLHAQTTQIIMSSGRTLGRRVLGAAKTQTLSPDPPPNRPQHSRNVSLLSPSESSISSQPSTPPTQDLAANVSLGQAAAAAASSRLVCPICNEEMVRPGLLSCLWYSFWIC
jgi:hypothetical protein